MSQHSIGVDQAPSDASVELATDVALALPVESDGLDRRRLLQGVGALAALAMVGGPGRAVADDGESSVETEADQGSVKSEPDSSGEAPPDPGPQDCDTPQDRPDNAPPEKVVLSFFYNGTDSNYDDDFERNGRFQHGELVSRLGYYAQVATMKSSDEPHNRDSTRRIHGVGLSKRHRPRLHRVFGRVAGKGMRKDITEIAKVVMGERARLFSRHQHKEQPTELCVSLLGWSRGGIGSIYAAHKIAKQWQKAVKEHKKQLEKSGSKSNYDVTLRLCVIAMDPVSGKGTNVKARDRAWGERKLFDLFRKRTRWWQLDSARTEFHSFYAHDERSIGFAATIPSMTGEPNPKKKTEVHLYEVPGTHSTLVGNTYPNGGDAAFKAFERSVRDMERTGHDAFFRSTDGAPRLSTDDRLPLYRSECEGKHPSTSSMCQDNPEFVDPVGQFIYRRVATKVLNILTDFGVRFPDVDTDTKHTVLPNPTSDIETFSTWLNRLGIGKSDRCAGPYLMHGNQSVILNGPAPVPAPNLKYEPKTPSLKLNDKDMRRTVAEELAAYKARCQETYIWLDGGTKRARRQGRGVYIGSNKQERHWPPNEPLSDFIKKKNYWLRTEKTTANYARWHLVSDATPCTIDGKRKSGRKYWEGGGWKNGMNCETKRSERGRLKTFFADERPPTHTVTVHDFDPYRMNWTAETLDY